MSSTNIDKVFAGSIPKIYETYLVPLIFQPYADDLAERLGATSDRPPSAQDGTAARRSPEEPSDDAPDVSPDLQ